MISTYAPRVLYEALEFPVFQNKVYDSQEGAVHCPKADIRLVEDLQSGLVYNALFEPELMAYDAQYQNEQGESATFCKHLNDVADIIRRTLGTRALIEVGCGKGGFLEMLLKQGFDITGFDPAYEGDNPRIQQHYFREELDIHAHGIVLRHVLEHVQDPITFLQSLSRANSEKGLIYIEVPCLDWINRNNAWFDIFYEHVNYFRLTDFSRIFGRIVASGHLFGGQYLYVVADLASIRLPVIQEHERINFAVRFEAKQICQDSHTPVAVWGASSKGVIFALMRSRIGLPIDLAVDINPAKQNKFMPVTGVPILSPGAALPRLHKGATIFVVNSNYFDEIRTMSGDHYHYVCVDSRVTSDE
ncbi:MAG: methyltransferase domain-containing protein [Chromatiales bacterium]|nr:methyltransferase domain-containing protein [Chromatiales bacterium]